MTTLPAIPETPQTASELLKHYPIIEMAKAFREGTAEIIRLMQTIRDQGAMMKAAFFSEGEKDDYCPSHPFDVDFRFEGESYYRDDAGERIKEKMKRRAWSVLVEKIGLRNIMSVKKRKEFDEQLKSGELPDVTEESILDVLMGLCGQAQDFAKEASLEVFDILRPRGAWGGHYKTNDAFRVGRRVILPGRVERQWSSPKFRVSYYHDQDITAIDGVFHLLDGKGVMREYRGPLYKAIEESPDGRGETEYFRFKCFKNRNLHLKMKRLDLVRQLNLLATGEHVLGHDME